MKLELFGADGVQQASFETVPERAITRLCYLRLVNRPEPLVERVTPTITVEGNSGRLRVREGAGI